MKAALAPNMSKPYRVCDECYTKLKQASETSSVLRNPKTRNENVRHKPVEVAERETTGPKLQTTLTRFSSFSSANQLESLHSRSENQSEANHSCAFPPPSGASQLKDFNLSKAPNLVAGGGPKKVTSASVPVSRVISRATSPVSAKSSPPWSSEETDLKRANESLNQEIMILRAQVADLTHKSQNLEAELENTAKQLKDITAIAADEAEKSKSAKDVIKSLTAQLKEVAERLPEGHIVSCSSTVPIATNSANLSNQLLCESTLTNMMTPERDSNGSFANQILPNGSKAQQTGKTEWVVQDEPGVYITLSSLPGGGNELKRVRFSRKHFTEEQAERWWAENGAKIYER